MQDSLRLYLTLDGVVAPLVDRRKNPAIGLADVVDLSDLPGAEIAQSELLAIGGVSDVDRRTDRKKAYKIPSLCSLFMALQVSSYGTEWSGACR